MPPHHLRRFGRQSLNIDGHVIKPSKCANVYLGFLLINIFQCFNRYQCRQNLQLPTSKYNCASTSPRREAYRTAVQSLVVPRMDCCAQFAYWSSDGPNATTAAGTKQRIISRVGHGDHMSPVLAALNMGSLKKIRILTYVYKCLNQL